MTSENLLETLRHEIDAIDQSIHDLLMRRAETVGRIGEIKGPRAPKFRPGREAAILRTLAARHNGVLPTASLLGLWRQLISAYLGLQGPFTVGVLSGGDNTDFGDLARLHFGHTCTLRASTNAKGVLEDVTRGRATIGIVPVPERNETEAWWPRLVTTAKTSPRVIARLPFAGTGNSRSGNHEALVIGLMPPEPSGTDRTLLVLDADEAPPFAQIQTALRGAGLKPRQIVPHEEAGAARESGPWLCLVDVDGFIEGDGGRLQRLAELLPVRLRRLVNLGSYAVPLGKDELETRRPATPRKANYGRRATDRKTAARAKEVAKEAAKEPAKESAKGAAREPAKETAKRSAS